MNRLFRDVDGGSLCPRGSVVCIGAFDGLHLGHRALAGRACQRAHALGVQAVALSFEPLPREFFARDTLPPRLTLPRDRIQALLGLGIDRLGLLRQVAVAALGLVAVVLVLRGVWQDWGGWSWWGRGWRLSLLVGGGATVYVGLLLLQGLRPRDLRG